MNIALIAESIQGVGVEKVLTLAATIVGALVAAIVFLFKGIQKNMKDSEERLSNKLDECETQHADANNKILDLSVKVGELSGRVAGMSGMQILSEQVLDKITKTEEVLLDKIEETNDNS